MGIMEAYRGKAKCLLKQSAARECFVENVGKV